MNDIKVKFLIEDFFESFKDKKLYVVSFVVESNSFFFQIDR